MKPPRVDVYQYKGKLPHYENMDPAYNRKETELVDFDLYSHEGVMIYNAKTQTIVEKEELEWLFEIAGRVNLNIPDPLTLEEYSKLMDKRKKYLEEE